MPPQHTNRSTLPTDGAPAPAHADRFLAVVAADAEVLFAGPSLDDVLGFERARLIGEDLLAYVHPNDRDAVADAVSAVAGERRVTHRFRVESGGYTWVESVVDEEASPHLGGRVLTARCVDVDRTFPEGFREFLEYGTDIVTVVDGDGRVRYESPSVEDVLGYEQGSLVGRSPLGYVHPEDRERVTEGFYAALANPESAGSMEFRYRTAAGDWVWLESRARALPDDAVVGRLVINSRDVTERKRRERRLVDRNERLDRFASIVSHDLRNPLSVVRASMEMARMRDDVDPLERGERAADRIDRLISELLTLARQGESIDETVEFTLAGVAREAWETAGDEAGSLVVEENARVHADRSRLRQAFENLFRNSVEHGSTSNRTEPGDSVEHGSTSNRTESGDTDEHTASTPTVTVGPTEDGFYVADDGPGIDPADRDRVFDPGFTTDEDGTGYGLDIVREIVEAHGWSVDVDPAADGARFEVVAPGPEAADDEPWVAAGSR